MKPVFISYSSKHRDLTRELAEVIEAQYGAGSVWWDNDLESRASYSNQIKTALEAARVVVVVWTAGAMISDWVYAEAVDAQRHGKLVNVRPSDMSFREIPPPFNIHHVDDAGDHASILATIAKVMNGTPIPTRVPLYEIYHRQHGVRLIDPKQDKVRVDPREISPTELLQARYGVVDYIDATGFAAALVDWCEDAARATAGRLIHGPGGLGKTRLMVEVAAVLRQKGWMAGFLTEPNAQDDTRQRWQALEQLTDQGSDSGLLIVIDYAEGRQNEVREMADRLSRRPENDSRPVRLILLARSAGDWWTALHDETPEVQRLFASAPSSPGVIELPSISTGQQRLNLLDASLRAFAPLMVAQGYENPTGELPAERLAHIATEASHTRPLAIQMEAMLWLASTTPVAGLTSIDALLDRVLGLERRHWKKLPGDMTEARTRDMSRGVAQVTVIQGVPSRESAERLLMADEFYKGLRTARVHVDPVIGDLSRVYGRANGGIAQMEPDLIGEHHVATGADKELIDACVHWIRSEPEDTREKRRRALLTVLQRATYAEHGARASGRAVSLLDHLITTHVKSMAADMVAVMVDTPGALADRLQQALSMLDVDALEEIERALPLQSLALMDLSMGVASRLAETARYSADAADADRTTPDDVREAALRLLAARVGNLGIRLSNLGRREEALAASQEAVDLYRRLAQARPDAFLPDLASSLNNLGGDLSNLGRREEALAASQEAVDLYRRLAQARPDAFLPDLASSLNNLGADLSNLGRREEALAASQEAVDIRRRLAQARPDAFLPELPMSLNNLGNRLSDLGRREDALAASLEAVDLYRRLAQARPDAFLPALAMSLNNLGLHLSDIGRPEDALVASQEAVDLYRRLAQARPDAFSPSFAPSLSNLGIRLSNLGRREEALAASQEAVDLYRRLAQARPDAFLPALATSLNNLAGDLSNLGRREEALVASQEAVDLYRRLAQARPDAFLPALASSISVQSDVLAANNRHADAAAAAHDALDTLAPFVEAYPEAHGDLARQMAVDLMQYSEAAGQEVDAALLERIARALGENGMG